MTKGLIHGHSINLVESEALSELWHKRLSHMSDRGITYLAKKNLLAVMKQAKVKILFIAKYGNRKEFIFTVILLQESLSYWS